MLTLEGKSFIQAFAESFDRHVRWKAKTAGVVKWSERAGAAWRVWKERENEQ